MTLAKVYCEEGRRSHLTSNEISATDQQNSRVSQDKCQVQSFSFLKRQRHSH